MKRLLLLPFLTLPALADNFVPVPFQLNPGAPADATQVMADLNSLTANGNAAIVALQAQMAAKGVGLPIPSGTLAPFYLFTCPVGWTDLNTEFFGGYFLRGLSGSYTWGAAAASSFASHYHALGSSYISAVGAATSGQQWFAGIYHAVPLVSFTGGGYNTSGGMTSGNIASETRPKNVALLYCYKN